MRSKLGWPRFTSDGFVNKENQVLLFNLPPKIFRIHGEGIVSDYHEGMNLPLTIRAQQRQGSESCRPHSLR